MDPPGTPHLLPIIVVITGQPAAPHRADSRTLPLVAPKAPRGPGGRAALPACRDGAPAQDGNVDQTAAHLTPLGVPLPHTDGLRDGRLATPMDPGRTSPPDTHGPHSITHELCPGPHPRLQLPTPVQFCSVLYGFCSVLYGFCVHAPVAGKACAVLAGFLMLAVASAAALGRPCVFHTSG